MSDAEPSSDTGPLSDTGLLSQTADDDLTVAAFQRHIDGRYGPTDRARGSAATFVWFVEEVGELASAVNAKRQPPGGKGDENLREEFADVFAWLCTLANVCEVDLASAVRDKYLRGDGPSGVK